MIEDVEKGIYIVGDGSYSIDQQRYNFQFGGQLFYEIKDGKIAGMLRDVAYQANTQEFWNSCAAICDERDYRLGGSFFDGKGQPGQVSAVSHGSATTRFNGVNVINTARKIVRERTDHDDAEQRRSAGDARRRSSRFSKAEACEANLNGNTGGNIRYARNTRVDQRARTDDMTLAVQSSFGKRSGTATINEFDDASLEKAVRRSEELARLAPENPEFMPPLGPQQYVDAQGLVRRHRRRSRPSTAPRRPATASARRRRRSCVAAGFLEDAPASQAMPNSQGPVRLLPGDQRQLLGDGAHRRRHRLRLRRRATTTTSRSSTPRRPRGVAIDKAVALARTPRRSSPASTP